MLRTPIRLTPGQSVLDAFLGGLHHEPNGEEPRETLVPALDVLEDDKGYTVYLEVPGIAREDLELELEENQLLLRGARKPRAESAGAVRRSEQRFGTFERTLRFGQPIEADGLTAKLELGLLTVYLPKQVSSRKRKIEILG